jgi:MFS family permease
VATVGPPEEPRDLQAVLGATFLVRFAFGITTAVFASYIIGHSTNLVPSEYGTVGLVTSLASVAEFLTVLFSGMAADRWGRWRVLVAGMASAALVTALFTATRDPFALGGLNFAFGIASGAILASSLAIVADEAPRGVRGHAMGRFDAVNLAGWIIGFAVGLATWGSISNADLGWVFVIGTVALVGGLLFVRTILRRYPPTVRPRAARTPFPLARVFRKDVLVVTLPWLVIYMLIGTALIFVGISAGGVGIPPIYLAVIIAVGGGLLTVTQPGFGRLADRFGAMPLMMVGTGGFVLVLAGAGWLAYVGGLQVAPVVLIALGAIGALAYGPAALSALAELSSSVSRATTMAVYTLCISLGMTLGLLLSTQLYSTWGAPGLDAYFAGIAVVLVVLAGVRYRAVVSTRRATTPAQ